MVVAPVHWWMRNAQLATSREPSDGGGKRIQHTPGGKRRKVNYPCQKSIHMLPSLNQRGSIGSRNFRPPRSVDAPELA
jgi:hypothetical protein